MSLPVRGAWIEIEAESSEVILMFLSLPVRGAWIEMYNPQAVQRFAQSVAPRAGSVD